jgi:hypothetical protein
VTDKSVFRSQGTDISQSNIACRRSYLEADTYIGISTDGRGVFNHENGGRTYAGQCRDGHACGLGVFTGSSGDKEFAEHCPDEQDDGRHLCCFSYGLT